MRKRILLVSLITTILFSSCMTFSTNVETSIETNDKGVSIEITKLIQEKGFGFWTCLIPLTTSKTIGIEVLIKNNTDVAQSINWNQSSLNINNKSSPLFLPGMKYTNAGTNSIPNTAVGVGKSIKVQIYPSNNVEWDGKNWKIDGMKLKQGDELSLIIFTESGIQIESTYILTKNDGIHFLW